MSIINFIPDTRIVPTITSNDREIVFTDRAIVRLIASFLDRTQDVRSRLVNQDVRSFRLVNRRMYTILSFGLANPRMNTIQVNNSRLLSGSYEGTIRIWNFNDGPNLFQHNSSFTSVLPPANIQISSGLIEQPLPNYTDFVQIANDLRYGAAIQNNKDGEKYLKSVIDEHMQTLSDNERIDFKQKISEIDPELFTIIPHLVVRKAISSPVPLTGKNTPRFMHDHLVQLEKLRQKQKPLNATELMKECGIIATSLQRKTDCIASMQKALQSFI